MFTSDQMQLFHVEAWQGPGFEERQAFHKAVTEAEKEWEEWLFMTYADDFSTQAAGFILTIAKEKTSQITNYSAVEETFSEFIQLIRKVKEIDFA